MAFLSACGGGGGGGAASVTPTTSTPAVPSTPGSTTKPIAGMGSATLSITVPKKTTSSTSRSAQYIDPNTQSLTLTLLATDNPNPPATSAAQGPFALAAGSPGCTSGSAGVTCTFQISAPVGNDIFSANSYTSTNAASGTQLGSGAIALRITQNVTNTASLTLTGPIANIIVVSDGVTLSSTARQAASVRSPKTTGPVSQILVIALDAQGNTILNPTTFDIPVHLKLNTNGMANGDVTLTATYAGLPSEPLTPEFTSTNGGTVDVFSPSDRITLTLNNHSATGSPGVGAIYTPQAGPNKGIVVTSTPVTLTAGVPGLGISSVHTTATFSSGGNGTFQLTASNIGASATTGSVTVIDSLPAGLTIAAVSPLSGWTCASTSQTATCTSSAPIAANGGTSAVGTVVVNVLPAAIGVAINSVSISGGGTVATTTSTDTVSIIGAFLTLAQSVGGSLNATSGYGFADFSFSIGNTGLAITNGPLYLTDTLPLGMTFAFSYFPGQGESIKRGTLGSRRRTLGTQDRCVAVGQVVTCTLGVAPGTAIAAGASFPTFAIEAAIAANALATTTNVGSVSGGSAANAPAASSTFAISGGFTSFGPLVLTPQPPSASDHLQLLCISSGNAACNGTLAATESSYTGSMTASINNTSTANGLCSGFFQIANATIGSPPYNFTIVPTSVSGLYAAANPATYCTITVTDGNNVSTSIPVTVSSNSVTGQ